MAPQDVSSRALALRLDRSGGGGVARSLPILAKTPRSGQLTSCKQSDNSCAGCGRIEYASTHPEVARHCRAGSGCDSVGKPRLGLAPTGGEAGGLVTAVAAVEEHVGLRTQLGFGPVCRHGARDRSMASADGWSWWSCGLRGCAARSLICDAISLSHRTAARTHRRDQQGVHRCAGNPGRPVSHRGAQQAPGMTPIASGSLRTCWAGW